MSKMAEQVVNTTLKRGHGKRGHYRATYENDVFQFWHYETMTLEVNLAEKKIVKWDGWSVSDRDSLNDVLGELGLKDYTFFIKNSRLQLASGYPWEGTSVKYAKDMTMVNDKEATKKDNAVKKKIDKAIKEFGRRIDENDLSEPNGECWSVSLMPGGLENCKRCQFFADPECGGGKWMLHLVMQKQGYRCPEIFIHHPVEFKSDILRSLRRFYRETLAQKVNEGSR